MSKIPKLRMDDDEFDVNELESAEYEESEYRVYEGEIPPKNTILTGIVKKAWWSFTQYDDRMMRVIWEADDDAGEYAGLGVWDNIVFNAKSKWRWKPFIDAMGITLIDIKKRMVVEGTGEEDDGHMGAVIENIGKWTPGDDSTASRIVTDRSRRDGKWQADVAKWLPYEAPDDDEEEEEEAPPARPTRAAVKSARTSKAGAARRKPAQEQPTDPWEEAGPEDVDDFEDDDEEMTEEEAEEIEEDEQPARTASKRRAAPAPAAPRSKATRPVAAVSARRTGTSGKVAGRAKPVRRSADDDNEPPF